MDSNPNDHDNDYNDANRKKTYDDTKVIPETLPSTSLQVTDLEIQDIEGIGATTRLLSDNLLDYLSASELT